MILFQKKTVKNTFVLTRHLPAVLSSAQRRSYQKLGGNNSVDSRILHSALAVCNHTFTTIPAASLVNN